MLDACLPSGRGRNEAMRRGLVVVVAAAAGAAGCGDSSVSSSGHEESAESQIRDVVLRNIAAKAQGNGRAFCSTCTRSYIERTYGGYRRCVDRFTHPPDRAAHPPRPRFTNLRQSTDGHAIAELRLGGGGTQRYTVDRVNGRWLISEVGGER
jgi:hypothetical protein